MKKTLKTIEVADAYQLIEGANYQSLSDADKVKLWKISRVLKPTAVQFLSDKQDAIKSFITPEFAENFRKCKEFETAKDAGKELPFPEEEYHKYGKDVVSTNQLMEAALGELADKEVTLEFEPLEEDALGKLITRNGWPFSDTDKLEWMTSK